MKYVKYLLIFFAGLVFVLLLAPVWADNGHGHHHDDGGGDLFGGDNSIGDQIIGGDSSKALGLGFSYTLGDVDLNEGRNCYVSTAKGNIIFGRQKVELNPWCAALFYDANRKHEFAGMLRCGIGDILNKYETTDACVLDQTLGEIVSSPLVNEVLAKFQEFEDEREVLVEEIRQELEQQNERVNQLSSRRAVPERVYIDEGAERRAAAKVALQGKNK